MKQFEYYIERTTKDSVPDFITLGLKGWELVSIATIHEEEGWQDYKYFFKREKEPEKKEEKK